MNNQIESSARLSVSVEVREPRKGCDSAIKPSAPFLKMPRANALLWLTRGAAGLLSAILLALGPLAYRGNGIECPANQCGDCDEKKDLDLVKPAVRKHITMPCVTVLPFPHFIECTIVDYTRPSQYKCIGHKPYGDATRCRTKKVWFSQLTGFCINLPFFPICYQNEECHFINSADDCPAGC